MKNPYLTLCAFVTLAGLANAEPGQATDAKRQAPQPPVASGTSNGGDVDKALPKTTPEQKTTEQHGSIKSPKPEASSTEKPKMPKDDGTTVTPVQPKDTADKSDKVTDTPDKVTTRDHGADKVITPSGKETEDKSKDAKTEDKAKSDKISDRDHGTQKSKN